MRTPPNATPPVGGTIRRGVRSSPGQKLQRKMGQPPMQQRGYIDSCPRGLESQPLTPQGTGRCCSDAASDRAGAPQSWPPRCFFLKIWWPSFLNILYFVGKNTTPLPKRSGVLTCKGRAPGTFRMGIKITTPRCRFCSRGGLPRLFFTQCGPGPSLSAEG